MCWPDSDIVVPNVTSSDEHAGYEPNDATSTAATCAKVLVADTIDCYHRDLRLVWNLSCMRRTLGNVACGPNGRWVGGGEFLGEEYLVGTSRLPIDRT